MPTGFETEWTVLKKASSAERFLEYNDRDVVESEWRRRGGNKHGGLWP